MSLNLLEDMHIHSTFSDGIHTVEENVRQSETIGLSKICCVDHVRVSTDWLPKFVETVENVRQRTNLTVNCGIEAKILNENGELDIPANTDGVDYLYAADHQVPFGDRFYSPREIREMISEKTVTKNEVINAIVNSTVNVMENYRNIVIAHLFSVLPKIGADENDVSENQLEKLADTAKKTCAVIEIDERWKCPTFRTVTFFQSKNVPIRFSSDSHRKETIGKYRYNAELYFKLL
jgi:putative hydrolase